MFNAVTSLEQWVQLGQNQFDKTLRFANIGLNGAEKLAQLQLNLSKDFLADQAQLFKSLFDIKDVQALLAFQGNLAQPSMEKSVAASRTVYETLAELQSQFSAFVESEAQEAHKQFTGSLDGLLKGAPAGSDVAVAAIKSALAAASNAYDTVSQAAKKVTTDLVEAGVSTAGETAKTSTTRRKPAAAA
ncbi:phasin family protein [Leeia sp.]|uniref:phasin family protein n=1 Tax=Leeia sp. TaxID=2884678 RepID=UPI0035B38E36